MIGHMTIQRMDNVAIVVDDLHAAVAFFAELGLELDGRAEIEGPWADLTVGLGGILSEIAMMRTPDGHSAVELTRYHSPVAEATEPENPPPNTLGLHRIMFAVDDIDGTVDRLRAHGAELLGEVAKYERAASGSVTSAGPRASSSPWPNRSSDAVGRRARTAQAVRRSGRQAVRPSASIRRV